MGVKIHKSVVDARITTLVANIVDADGIEASVESTTFDAASRRSR